MSVNEDGRPDTTGTGRNTRTRRALPPGRVGMTLPEDVGSVMTGAPARRETFEFQNHEFQLRVTPAGDSFHVEAPGLAKALGFRDSYGLVRSVPEGEKGYTLVRTPGGEQQVWYLTEAGFYRALGQRQTARIKDGSVRDQVARFQDWVYGDVLVSIRRTGAYGSAPALDSSAALAALTSRDLAKMILAEADRADVAERHAAELEPAADAWAALAEASGDYSLREAALILTRDHGIEIGQNRLMRHLRDAAMVDERGRPYAAHNSHLVARPTSYTHPHTGEPVLTHQVRVTLAGIQYLRRRLGGIGTKDAA